MIGRGVSVLLLLPQEEKISVADECLSPVCAAAGAVIFCVHFPFAILLTNTNNTVERTKKELFHFVTWSGLVLSDRKR